MRTDIPFRDHAAIVVGKKAHVTRIDVAYTVDCATAPDLNATVPADISNRDHNAISFDPLTGTLYSFGTYTVGFVARPIGGVVTLAA